MKHAMKISLMAVLVAGLASVAQAEIFSATESGWIRNDNTGSSGGTNELAAGTISDSTTFRSIYQFDVSSLAVSADSATLDLYVSDNSPDDAGEAGLIDAELYLVLKPVVSGEMNWNEASSETDWDTPGGDFGTAALAVTSVDPGLLAEDDALSFSSAALAQAVQDAADSDGILTLMLRTPALEDSSFAARSIVWTKGSTSGNVPQLTVVPEPASMSLLALGGLAMLRRRR